MGFWGLLGVASMSILQVLIVSAIGAFMATDYLNLLPSNTRNSLNKIVFVVFTPSLIFVSLVETVTFQDIISMWLMPINIGITFLCGGILGWIAVKPIKPKPHLEGLIIAMCSTGNFAHLLLIMVPAICTDDGSPFGDHGICKAKGLSYASFSMALGSFYTWTCTYQMIQASALKYNVITDTEKLSSDANKSLDADENTHLLNKEDDDHINTITGSRLLKQEGKTPAFVLPFCLPTQIILIYGDIAHFGAGVFLLIQLISIISFITWLNDCCLSEKYAERCHIHFMLLVTTAYVVCILGIILMYIWYTPQATCLLNIFFITWTLVLLQLMTSVSLHPKVGAVFLTPGFLGLYIVFLCWSDIRSEPLDNRCLRNSGASRGWLTIIRNITWFPLLQLWFIKACIEGMRKGS